MRFAILASLAGIAALAMAAPAAQADPVHLYTGQDGWVGAQEHATPVGFGLWLDSDEEGTDLHVRYFFTHCTVGITTKLGEIVCAV